MNLLPVMLLTCQVSPLSSDPLIKSYLSVRRFTLKGDSIFVMTLRDMFGILQLHVRWFLALNIVYMSLEKLYSMVEISLNSQYKLQLTLSSVS